MQFTQGGYRDLRLAELHAHAYHGIQHPRRNYCDCARAVVDMDNTTTAALFAISIAHLTPAKRMPAIVNLYFLSDMGRMSVESPSGARTGCTWAASRPAQKSPPSSPSSRAAAGSAYPSANTSQTCCPASLTAPSTISPISRQALTPPNPQSNLAPPKYSVNPALARTDTIEHRNSGRLSGSRKRKQALLESNLPGILDPTHPTDVSSGESATPDSPLC